MIVGDQRPVGLGCGFVVEPDGGGQGQDALQDADDHARYGAAAVAFEVELGFEGLVDRLNDLPQRLEELCARARRLARASGAQQREPLPGEGGFEVLAVVVLVADQHLPGTAGRQRRIVFQDASSTCRSSALATARANPMGSPPTVAIRCSRSPQKYREWEAQYPYCAHPARSERLTVSRDRPHSTGVESTTQTSSAHSEASVASTRITTVIRAAEARSRLLYPGCRGR